MALATKAQPLGKVTTVGVLQREAHPGHNGIYTRSVPDRDLLTSHALSARAQKGCDISSHALFPSRM